MCSIRPLHPELALIAETDCFENPKQIEENVRAFKIWAETLLPHIRDKLIDQYVVGLLRVCKYDMELAKEKFVKGRKLVQIYPHLFLCESPISEGTKEIMKFGGIIPLSITSPSSPRTILYRHGTYNTNKFNVTEVTRYIAMSEILIARDCDNLAIAGVIAIIDTQYVTFKHILQANPLYLKKMASAVKLVIQHRLKGIHYINYNPWIAKLLKIFKSILGTKLRKRIFIHEKLEDLYEHVPKYVLPEEYGGTAGPVQKLIDDHEKNMLINEQLFKDIRFLMLGDEEIK